MNPQVDPEAIAAAYSDDPVAATAEYGAEFRGDIEIFLTREIVDACTVPGRHEVAPVRGTQYTAFTDPSGGSADSMTLAIAHRQGERGILDALRERKPPFSPRRERVHRGQLGTTVGSSRQQLASSRQHRAHSVNAALAVASVAQAACFLQQAS
jgi:hypothetical protein